MPHLTTPCGMWRLSAAAALLACATVGLAGEPGRQAYVVQPIDSIGTGEASIPLDLNDQGVVVGIATSSFGSPPATLPWRWSFETGVDDITPAGEDAPFASVTRINDNSVVIGGFLYPPKNPPLGAMPLGGTAGGDDPLWPPSTVDPMGIPGAVPLGSTGTGKYWQIDPLGRAAEVPGLGTLLGVPDISVGISDLNNVGQFVGISQVDDGSQFGQLRPFFYDRVTETLIDLSDIGGPGSVVFTVTAMNDDGQMTGIMNIDNRQRVYQYHLEDGLTIVPTFEEETRTIYEQMNVVAMNADGTVLGTSNQVTETGETIVLVGPDGIPVEVPVVEIEYLGMFIWNEESGLQQLGLRQPGDIGDDGTVLAAEIAFLPGSALGIELIPAMWQDGVWTDLSYLLDDILLTGGYNPDTFNFSSWSPGKINNKGQMSAVAIIDGEGVLFPSRVAFLLTPFDGTIDLNGDGSVGPADLAQLLGNWGPCANPADCPEDLTGDGVVGPADLAMLLGNWG